MPFFMDRREQENEERACRVSEQGGSSLEGISGNSKLKSPSGLSAIEELHWKARRKTNWPVPLDLSCGTGGWPLHDPKEA
jgi:hypothetical protein